MRVKIDNFGKVPYFGVFIGLIAPNTCDRCGSDMANAVVLADGFGMFVDIVHPSRVTFVTPEEEKIYKA